MRSIASDRRRERAELGFDPDALRAKYREERDQRWRPQGDQHFLAVRGEHAHYADADPYAPVVTPRAPLQDETELR